MPESIDGKACTCWYGPPIVHYGHCCFREELIETLFGAPEVACGHKPNLAEGEAHA